MSEPGVLSETQRAMLDLESHWWPDPLLKEQAIRDRFGWSPAAYYRRLNELIDDPTAWMTDPLVVKRLQRRRAARRGPESLRDLVADVG
jgi:hypothetical protein